MSRPKTLHVGAGVVTRHRNGACTFTCRHDGCHAFSEPRGWRVGVRQARQHDASHAATEARNVGMPWGVPAHELPRPAGRRPLRRLANVVLILALAALLVSLVVANANSHAAPGTGAASTAVVSTTTLPTGPGPEGYVPTLAGPPATDANGAWIPAPDEPPAQASSNAGGGR
jgi:hypothetical protein